MVHVQPFRMVSGGGGSASPDVSVSSFVPISLLRAKVTAPAVPAGYLRRASPRRAAGATSDRVAGPGRIREDDGPGGHRPGREGARAGRRLDLAGRRRYAERVRELSRRRVRAGRPESVTSEHAGHLDVVAGGAADGDAGPRGRAARGALPAGAGRGRPASAPHAAADRPAAETRAAQSPRCDGVPGRSGTRPGPAHSRRGRGRRRGGGSALLAGRHRPVSARRSVEP